MKVYMKERCNDDKKKEKIYRIRQQQKEQWEQIVKESSEKRKRNDITIKEI